MVDRLFSNYALRVHATSHLSGSNVRVRYGAGTCASITSFPPAFHPVIIACAYPDLTGIMHQCIGQGRSERA